MKDERLDLDGIWCPAQWHCSLAPSPLGLPLGCLSCLKHSASHTEPLCKQCEVSISTVPLKQDGDEGLQGPWVKPSHCPAPELMLRPRGPHLPTPSLLSLPPNSNLLKPVHSFQALQLDLFILAVISLLSSAYKFQGHSMLTLG